MLPSFVMTFALICGARSDDIPHDVQHDLNMKAPDMVTKFLTSFDNAAKMIAEPREHRSLLEDFTNFTDGVLSEEAKSHIGGFTGLVNDFATMDRQTLAAKYNKSNPTLNSPWEKWYFETAKKVEKHTPFHTQRAIIDNLYGGRIMWQRMSNLLEISKYKKYVKPILKYVHGFIANYIKENIIVKFSHLSFLGGMVDALFPQKLYRVETKDVLHGVSLSQRSPCQYLRLSRNATGRSKVRLKYFAHFDNFDYIFLFRHQCDRLKKRNKPITMYTPEHEDVKSLVMELKLLQTKKITYNWFVFEKHWHFKLDKRLRLSLRFHSLRIYNRRPSVCKYKVAFYREYADLDYGNVTKALLQLCGIYYDLKLFLPQHLINIVLHYSPIDAFQFHMTSTVMTQLLYETCALDVTFHSTLAFEDTQRSLHTIHLSTFVTKQFYHVITEKYNVLKVSSANSEFYFSDGPSHLQNRKIQHSVVSSSFNCFVVLYLNLLAHCDKQAISYTPVQDLSAKDHQRSLAPL